MCVNRHVNMRLTITQVTCHIHTDKEPRKTNGLGGSSRTGSHVSSNPAMGMVFPFVAILSQHHHGIPLG